MKTVLKITRIWTVREIAAKRRFGRGSGVPSKLILLSWMMTSATNLWLNCRSGRAGLRTAYSRRLSPAGTLRDLPLPPVKAVPAHDHSGWRNRAAAGKIHTDFEKAFIRAQTIAFTTLLRIKANKKAAGKMRAEGKDTSLAMAI